MTALKLFALALTYCVIMCAFVQPASAGTYKVYSCQFPDGSPAPTEGWQVVNPHPGVGYRLRCDDGYAMLAVWLHADRAYPRGLDTGIVYRLPSDLKIVGVRARDEMWASVGDHWTLAAGYMGYHVPQQRDVALQTCQGCHVRRSDWSEVIRGHDLQSVSFGVQCSKYATGDCPPERIAGLRVFGVELTVRDDAPPQLSSAPRGSLLDPTVMTRFRDLSFEASDVGSGLRAAVLEIDGHALDRYTFSSNGRSCAPPYSTAVPCPLTGAGRFVLDTSSLTPGPHRGRLLVYDASDSAPHELPFAFRVFDPEHPVSACVDDQPLAVKTGLASVKFGKRHIPFVASGVSPRPKVLHVLDEENDSAAIGTAKLRRGRYIANLRIDRPRLLRLAARLPKNAFACSESFRIAVRAGIRLDVRPRHVVNGQSIRFGGRLLGSGAAERRIEIHARAKGGTRQWTLVRVVRSDEHGRFAMTYRFRRTFQRVEYQFRAVKRRENGFPYEPGRSAIRTVTVVGG